MTTSPPAASAAVSSQVRAFGRVLGRPVLRQVLPAMAVSAIGDGMSLVAVAWLAMSIAPPDQAGVWTALAVAAYALPATLGAAVLARWVRRLPGIALVTADATVRFVALGTIAALAIAGALTPRPTSSCWPGRRSCTPGATPGRTRSSPSWCRTRIG